MRTWMIGFVLLLAVPANANEAAPVASEQTSYIRALGRLNVNTATRAQLALVPGLDSAKIELLLQLRDKKPITDLEALALAEDVLVHLKTEGDSNLCRIRQNPLRRVGPSPASAAR